jgi:hypothetical protein
MRLHERVVAVLGAVLVAAAGAATAGVLGVHGMREPAPVGPARGTVPADLGLQAFRACTPPWEGDGGFVISMDEAGHIEFLALGGEPDPSASRAYAAAINACLAGLRFDEFPSGTHAARPSPAERLLAFDYAWRWMLPCLAGHARQPPEPPEFSESLSPTFARDGGYYFAATREDFDALLEVRYACGPASGPFEAR